MFETFICKSYHDLEDKINALNAKIPISRNVEILKTPVFIKSKKINNRIAVQPMEGCDGMYDGKPGELTERRYKNFAKSGASLIWFESTAIVENGRANPRQLMTGEKNRDAFKKLVFEMKELCFKTNGFSPALILQANHAGRYSKPENLPEPIIAYNNPYLDKDPAGRIISDDELKTLTDAFGTAAKFAEDTGFDGIDVKACHGYIGAEILHAYNRGGEFGGCFENRSRLLLSGIESASAAVSSDFIVTSRLGIYDGYPYPYGFGMKREKDSLEPDMEEPLRLVSEMRSRGVNMINITMGNPYSNPHVNRPYDKGAYIPPEHPLIGISRMNELTKKVRETGITVISSANSYVRQFAGNIAAGQIENGVADIAGFGRLSFANQNFANDILNETLTGKNCCITCGKCTELMRAGKTAGCVVRDKIYTNLYKEIV